MAENGVISAKQRRAIVALLSERTVRAAAQKAGIGERTLTRWRANPDFDRELRRAERELL